MSRPPVVANAGDGCRRVLKNRVIKPRNERTTLDHWLMDVRHDSGLSEQGLLHYISKNLPMGKKRVSEQALFVDVHILYHIVSRWTLHSGGCCFQNCKIDRWLHVPVNRLWDLWCSFQANTFVWNFQTFHWLSAFFLQQFKQILIRKREKDRTESSEEVDFFREKYMPLKCLKQIGFVAFSPDSEHAYNPWLSLRFTVCRLSSGISNLAEKKKKKNHLNYLQATIPLPKLCSNLWYAVYCNTYVKGKRYKIVFGTGCSISAGLPVHSDN